ncbi:hypothetical protein TRFO_24447 [Tritrichomonas foetus]|uniref:Uncharacterized protein n=1 Tax=Tritrichomonas foetus TaxID=1144522 RepID=A0A1J4K830_9EUKA|nr:hypothetical protein TRFO_24447 [Tritrichomonas foetus]|eukprot:OHT07363.1 hypothetical protein TRFO_24447 [Tritrichomonas foetus]
MEKSNFDKINSFIARIDREYENLNESNLESITDSSAGITTPKYSTNFINEESNFSPNLHQNPVSQSQAKYEQSFKSSIEKSKYSNNSGNFSNNSIKQSTTNPIQSRITPQDEINFDLDDEERRNKRSWCERSIEQLEMTIQLLDQCLDNDIKDLNKQQGLIDLCRNNIEEAKRVFPI